MQEYVQEKTYRILLLERLGRRFSEREVTEILQQVLPQLDQIHIQGQAHGAISLDSLVQRDGRAVLMNIAPSLSGQLSMSEDIYALGIAMIELLTAKAPNEMREPNGKLNWEDYCLVSDQLRDALNRMVTDQPQNRLASVNEVLSALAFSVPRPAVWDMQGTYPTKLTLQPETTPDHSPQKQSRFRPWLWGLSAIGLVGLLTAITVPLLFSQPNKARQAEAKLYVQALNQAQIDFYKQNGRLAASVEDLRIGLPLKAGRKNYEYEVYLLDSTRAIATATAQQDELKSLSGIVFVSSRLIQSEICVTNEASRKPPRVLEVTGDFFQCPPGTQSLNSQNSGVPYSSNSSNLATPNSSLQSSQNQTANPFEKVSFPQSSCGDFIPTDPKVYPISFYPVFVEYSERNLQIIKLQFCMDAYEMIREKTGNKAIQVGSFTSKERANFFKNFLVNKVGNAEVGEPRTIESPVQ